MKKEFTACVALFVCSFAPGHSIAAEPVATTQQFLVDADGSVRNDSTTKYLSIEETILKLTWMDENNNPTQTISATTSGGESDSELQKLLIAGKLQNDINDMLPNINLGYKSQDSWYVEYTLKNTSQNSIITITDYRINLYAMHFNDDDGHTAIDGNVEVLLTPGYWDGSTHSMSQTTVNLTGSNSTDEAGVSHGMLVTDLIQAFTLNPGDEIKIFTTVMAPIHDEHVNGYLYIGLEGFQLAGTASPIVPEPTTATLSLLALAGLAARRRRK